jgi:hypothetical protein
MRGIPRVALSERKKTDVPSKKAWEKPYLEAGSLETP